MAFDCESLITGTKLDIYEVVMADERNSLDVLKAELLFIEEGGYRQSPRQAWRAPSAFSDSPTCMNFTATPGQRRACSECILMEWFPTEHHHESFPCRHIPLTEAGDSLHTIYSWASQDEVEEVVAHWLRARIEDLEKRV